MSRLRKILLLLTTLLLSACGTGPTHQALLGQKLPELIPVRDFVADRENNADYKISLDGKQLAWRSVCGIRPCLRIRRIESDVSTTLDINPGMFRWSPESESLIWVQDHQGDGNAHVWIGSLARPELAPRDLTPGKLIAQLIDIPDAKSVVVTHNRRDAKVFDTYRIDLATGAETLLATNPGNIHSWLIDRQGKLVGRVKQEGLRRILEVSDQSSERWNPVKNWEYFDTLEILGWDKTDSHLWVASNMGRDKIVLSRLELASGKEEVVYTDPDADIDVEVNRPRLGPQSQSPLAALSEPDYPRNEIFHPALKQTLQPFLQNGPVRVHINSIDSAEKWATVNIYDGEGTRFYLLDLVKRQATLLGEDSLSRQRGKLAKIRHIQFKSRDGLTLHGFLTLPRGLEEQKKLPLVLRVHGGPWWNNIWGNTHFWQAATQVQFFANRGYAVLEINFRGSTGYGRRFTEAAQGEFAGAMHNDLLDGVQWAIDQGIADPDKIAIVGGSYGGYATLVGLAFTPERFACGIASLAPVDLGRMISDFPPHGVFDQPLWHRYVGDPGKPEMLKIMDSKSPLFRAAAIRKPLLMIYGANDPLVKLGHAERMMQALRQSGQSGELLLFQDEGHGINRWQNNLKVYRRSEDFLAACLGGRSGGFDYYQLGNWLP